MITKVLLLAMDLILFPTFLVNHAYIFAMFPLVGGICLSIVIWRELKD